MPPSQHFAAHASASPTAPGSAIYGLWQAFYHQVGQWHAIGGAQGLTDALARRLQSYGGQWRTDAAVARVTRDRQRVTGVELESGEHIRASCVDTVEARAPGFRATIVGQAIRTPQDMADQLRWPGAHPMSVDVSLDQLGWLRPTRALSGHRTPIHGLFITGAGTAPVGGVAGSPGRAAAKAVLAWRRRSGASSPGSLIAAW